MMTTKVNIQFKNGTMFANVQIRHMHKVVEDREIIDSILNRVDEFSNMKTCDCIHKNTFGDIILDEIESFQFV